MRFNKIYKFSDGTLTHILEAVDYRVKEFKIKRLNPGMNTRFWTQKDVARSKEFMSAIERNPDGCSCWPEMRQSTTPCSHLIYIVKDIMIAERLTTPLLQL
ncbi:putative reverse transcriptase domain-containing protein [Tanacetum coccineum]